MSEGVGSCVGKRFRGSGKWLREKMFVGVESGLGKRCQREWKVA